MNQNNQIIILKPNEYSSEDVDKLRRENKIWREVDLVKQQLEELLEVRFVPDQQKANFLSTYGSESFAWIYYPWSGVLLRCLGERELFELRTNRNQDIITKDEQTRLHSATIGVAGMSVGAGIVLGAVYAGIGQTIKVADYDFLETANLNRVRESLYNVGQKKVDLAAQHIAEIDPFYTVQIFPEGINTENIDQFFTKPNLSVVVDEIDDFKMKVMLRVKAKEHKVPLLMFTSLGDNILVDVERYDIVPNQEIFNGAIGDVAEKIIANRNISPEDIKRYAVQVVGSEFVPTRALESLVQIGDKLVGRPQLYSTIAVDGGLAAFNIRLLILGREVKPGRYFIKFADLLNLETEEFSDTEARRSILTKLMGPPK